MSTRLCYSTDTYKYMLPEFAKNANAQLGNLERRFFPDGERYLRYLDDVRGQDIVILGGTVSDQDTLELFDLACSGVRYGARSLTLVVPYYGYSTMERAVKPGEIVTAKARARLISAIPQAYLGNTIVLLDLHAEGLPFYFSDTIQARHVYAKPLILSSVEKLGGNEKVLAATDSGRAKWVESLARDAGLPAAFVYRRRVSGNETQITGVNADVKGKDVLIYDDMIRTGGSLMGAARVYKDAGAARIYALTTHLLPPDGAMARIEQSGLFQKLIATNSHPRSITTQSNLVEIVDVGPLLGQSLGESMR
jgi:ribose-phosphate pyrophosphokinase